MKEGQISDYEYLATISRDSAEEDLKRAETIILAIVEYLKKGDRDDEERIANIEELVTVASKHDGFPIDDALEKFLDEAKAKAKIEER